MSLEKTITIHKPSDLALEELLNKLNELKQSGEISNFTPSNFGKVDLEKLQTLKQQRIAIADEEFHQFTRQHTPKVTDSEYWMIDEDGLGNWWCRVYYTDKNVQPTSPKCHYIIEFAPNSVEICKKSN